jgi:hypothetical protein
VGSRTRNASKPDSGPSRPLPIRVIQSFHRRGAPGASAQSRPLSGELGFFAHRLRHHWADGAAQSSIRWGERSESSDSRHRRAGRAQSSIRLRRSSIPGLAPDLERRVEIRRHAEFNIRPSAITHLFPETYPGGLVEFDTRLRRLLCGGSFFHADSHTTPRRLRYGATQSSIRSSWSSLSGCRRFSSCIYLTHNPPESESIQILNLWPEGI